MNRQLIWDFILQGTYRSYGLELTDVDFTLPKCSRQIDPIGVELWESAICRLQSDSVVAWACDEVNAPILQEIAGGILERTQGNYHSLQFAIWMTKTSEEIVC